MARERAAEARRQIVEDIDPITSKQRDNPKTFEDEALEVIESKRPVWKNAKHTAQLTTTLATYVFPKTGQTQVAKIETAEVINALTPIWTKGPKARTACANGLSV